MNFKENPLAPFLIASIIVNIILLVLYFTKTYIERLTPLSIGPTSIVDRTFDQRLGHAKMGVGRPVRPGSNERFVNNRGVGPRFNGQTVALQDYYASEGVAAHSTTERATDADLLNAAK